MVFDRKPNRVAKPVLVDRTVCKTVLRPKRASSGGLPPLAHFAPYSTFSITLPVRELFSVSAMVIF